MDHICVIRSISTPGHWEWTLLVVLLVYRVTCSDVSADFDSRPNSKQDIRRYAARDGRPIWSAWKDGYAGDGGDVPPVAGGMRS